MNRHPASLRYPKNSHVGRFELVRTAILKDLDFTLYEWSHPLGSKLIYIDKPDSNKVFSVAFRTTPQNSSGVAHILEHVVLCGSKRYPVRDPFFSMLKRSLQNFMNAFTASDWTMYPFATNNQTDFDNLMGVYLDASFFPLIRELSFQQEGWRFELKDKKKLEGDLEIKGVVFNEMKGAMSSQSEIVTRKTMQSIFPNNTYHYNSGGEPVEILNLTWEELKNFHKQYYHPSNAWFYLYGDLDLEQTVEKIEAKVLSKFEKNHTDTSVRPAKRLTAPIEVIHSIPAEEKEQKDLAEHQLLFAWLAPDVAHVQEVLLLKVLNQILLGSAGSPLRKALIESNLGKRLVDGTGFESETKETFFVIGLQGILPENLGKVEALIVKELQNIVQKGIEPGLIDSCLHQMELDMREIDSGPYGEGLKLLFRFFPIWLHGGDYNYALNLDAQFALVRGELKKDRIFEGLVEKYLLNNPHRVKLTFNPDKKYFDQQEQEIQRYIRNFARKANKATYNHILQTSLQLELEQNTKEDLSVLPKVTLQDVNKESERIDENLIHGWPIKKSKPIIFYHQATGGLVYIDFEFSLPPLSEEERLLLPTLSMLLVGAGTKKTDYSSLALKLNQFTGGISASPAVLAHVPGQKTLGEETLTLSGKTLMRNVTPFCSLLEEIIHEISFHDHARIQNLLKQRCDSLCHGILNAGHSYAGSLALRHLHPLNHLEELLSGVSQINFALRLNQQSSNLSEICEGLQNLAKKIFAYGKPRVVIVTEKKNEAELDQTIGKLLKSFPGKVMAKPTEYNIPKNISQEIWTTDTPVSYVAKAFSVPKYDDEASPALKIMATLLRGEYLHRTVREQGGAYGSMVGYDYMRGTFLLLSYRDPNLAKTWENFDEGIRWVAQGRFSQEDLESSILQVFCNMDKPLSPARKAFHDYNLRSAGVSKEMQDLYRTKLLACKKNDIVEVARVWKFSDAVATAITSKEIWEKNQSTIPNANRFKVQPLTG